MTSTFKDKYLFIIFSIILYYVLKPSITFKPTHKLREYGFGYDSEGYRKTLFTMYNVIILIVLLVLLI